MGIMGIMGIIGILMIILKLTKLLKLPKFSNLLLRPTTVKRRKKEVATDLFFNYYAEFINRLGVINLFNRLNTCA